MPPWYEDMEYAWHAAHPDEPATLPDALYDGVRKLLKPDEETSVHPVEDEAGPAYLFIPPDSRVSLVRFDDPNTRVTFLGTLDGGVYSETIQPAQRGHTLELRFFHERLRDGDLLATLEHISTPGAYSRLGAAEAHERGEALRRRFREWGAPG